MILEGRVAKCVCSGSCLEPAEISKGRIKLIINITAEEISERKCTYQDAKFIMC